MIRILPGFFQTCHVLNVFVSEDQALKCIEIKVPPPSLELRNGHVNHHHPHERLKERIVFFFFVNGGTAAPSQKIPTCAP